MLYYILIYIILLARGQKLLTALSLVRVEREPERLSRQAFEKFVRKIIYAQTRANYVTVRSLCALAMQQSLISHSLLF